MRYEISEKVKEDLQNIESYLLERWNLNVLENFFEKFENAIQILLEKKVIFKRYEDTIFYRFLVTKHNSIIYSYGTNVLYIHRILQNYQDPEENYKSLQP